MPHDFNHEWEHVYEWLEKPAADEGERQAKEWLDKFTMPAMDRDRAWLRARVLTCVFEGATHRVVGASRLGDIWLTSDLTRETGYDKRINIAECSGWLCVPSDAAIVAAREGHDDPRA